MLLSLALGRVIPVAAFGLALVAQAARVQAAVARAGGPGASVADRLGAANSALVLVYFALLVALYVVRLPRGGGDRRPAIVAAALAGTFLVAGVPLLPAAPRRDWLLLPSGVLAVAGMACALWSLLHLRRSFSILPEARRLVTGGPYGLSRNPLYLGELVTSWAVFLPTLAWPGALALAANAGLQLVRVRAEERVLARCFGQEYAEYRRRVPRFFPAPGRGKV